MQQAGALFFLRQGSMERQVCDGGGQGVRQKVLDPRAHSSSPAGLFFPGNINNGVKNECCGWHLLWHRMLPGKFHLLLGTGAVQSEARVSPEAFNFCAVCLCTKATAFLSQRGTALQLICV